MLLLVPVCFGSAPARLRGAAWELGPGPVNGLCVTLYQRGGDLLQIGSFESEILLTSYLSGEVSAWNSSTEILERRRRKQRLTE